MVLKKFFSIVSLVGALGVCGDCEAENMDVVLKETLWTVRAEKDWQKNIPAAAKSVQAELGKFLDLRTLDRTASDFYVYMKLEAPQDGRVSFGIGADWWFEAFINGKPLLSSMREGNMSTHFSPDNFPVWLPVKKGMNLLAVRVKCGSCGGGVVCGKSIIRPYDGKAELEARKTPLVPPKRSGASYRLIVLGDTHFDAPYEVYHAKYNEPNARLNRIQRAEFARNEAMWRSRGPRLLKAAAGHVNADTRAVIQLGDLIQGDCGDPEVHKRMLLDTLEAFKKEFNSLPFVSVTGNHDIRGTGAEKAYAEVMPLYHSRVLNRKVTGTTFYFTIEQDLFLMIDFNNPDFKVIFEAFEKHADCRYKFVISHGPVIPSPCGSARWCFVGNSDHARRMFRELFLKHDVMILTGHVHALEITECVTEQGRMTQLMANSVWEEESLAQPKVRYAAPDGYGKGVKAEYEELFRDYKDAVTQYWRADGAGYFVLDITPESIKAGAFGGDSSVPFKVWEFKK